MEGSAGGLWGKIFIGIFGLHFHGLSHFTLGLLDWHMPFWYGLRISPHPVQLAHEQRVKIQCIRVF